MQFQIRMPNATQDQTINVPACWLASPTWESVWANLVRDIIDLSQPAAAHNVLVELPGDLGGPLAIFESASLQRAVRARF